jgi:hypothetical protein
MKLFSEKVKYTSTNSSQNILQVEAFQEIFFGVYEIEINKSKYPVEKISEHEGNPVISVPVTVEGVKREYPFVLLEGKFELLFNEDNKLNDEYEIVQDTVKDILLAETVEEIEEVINIPEVVDNRGKILRQIQKAKKDAHNALQLEKAKNLKEIQVETDKKNKLLKETLEIARENLVEEFVSVSKKIREELVDGNDKRFDEIKETIDNKIDDLASNLSESLKKDFKQSSKIFDDSIKKLVKESYNSLQPKIDEELKGIATDIVEKVSSIEKELDKKLKDKADITLIENVEGELNAVSKANIELNDKINKGVNKALSRVGNADKKIDELTIALSEEVESKISKAEENITNYYTEKLKMLEEKTFDITEETRKYIIELVTESRNNLVEEIRKIKDEKPIEYIVESKGKKQSINSDDLVKDFDKKINSKIDNEVTRLRKYIAVYSGGGSVAMQFADGGTMNGDLNVSGNLTVVGTISASQYLGIPYPSENDTLDIVTSRGNITNNSIKVNTLSANSAHLTSVIEASAFVTTGGTSSDFVKGDGSLDSNTYITEEAFLSNLVLYPTTAVSDISGYSKMVASVTDIDYNAVAVDVSTGDITGTDVFISSLISAPDLIVGEVDTINLTVIGNIKKVSGGTNKNASFHFHAYKRSIGGVETLLGVSSNTATVTSAIYEEYDASLVMNTSDWIDTDRLVLKLYGTLVGSGGGSSPVFNFMFGGDTPVRVLLPLPTNVQLTNYIPYVGASKDINLGTHDVTTTGSISANNISLQGDLTSDANRFNDSTSFLRPSNDVKNWYLTGKTFSVAVQESGPTGVFFKPDGTLMYIIGSTGDDINVYTLGTPWDVTTAVFSYLVSVAAQDNAPNDLYISPDGLKLFMLGSQSDDVNEYNLVSPWVLTGMTFVASYLVGQGETTPTGLDFKPDGTKMYVVGVIIDTVFEYTLSTPWSVATATYSQGFSVAAQETTPAALTFNSDGTRLYLLGATGDDITEYRLSSPYDISTAVFFTTGFTFTAETAPQGIYFNGTQNKAYVVGTTLRVVYELGTDAQLKYHGDSFTFDSQMFVGGRSEFSGEAYFNSTVRTNGSLIIAGSITSNNTFTLTRNLANVSSDGFINTNTTVATNLIPVQRSPRSRWSGTVWDTGAAASRTINWTAEAIPTSGNPASSRLAFSYDLNAGGYTEFVSFTSAGNVGIGTTTPSAILHSLGTTEQLRVGFDASNYLSTTVNSSGLVTFNAVGASAGFVFSDPVTVNGNLTLGAAGNKINITEGSNASVGVATLVAGTATVNTTAVTTNSRIFLTRQTTAGTLGTSVDVTARVAGTSFTITSNGSILDTSTVAWFIIN